MSKTNHSVSKPVRFEDVLADKEGSVDAETYRALIKTVFDNVSYLNMILEQPESEESNTKIDEIVEIFHQILPKLHEIGFFKFFKPSELLSFSEDLGRTILVVEYLKDHFNDLDEEEQALLLPMLESLTEDEEIID